jgi:hypothetical protein
MKSISVLAGIIALSFSGSGLAKPGIGHGNGHAFAYGPGHGQAYAFDHEASRAHGLNGPIGYGVGGCPPGLAKKAIPCVPPGQAKRFSIGSRIPMGYDIVTYGSLPHSVRTRHNLSTSSRYIYNGDTLYEVSPRTRTVTRVVRTR